MLLQHARYYGLGMSGHRCTGDRMLLEHERCSGLGMDATVTVAMVWAWMYWWSHALELARYYALATDAPVTVCSWYFGLNMDALVTLCSKES